MKEYYKLKSADDEGKEYYFDSILNNPIDAIAKAKQISISGVSVKIVKITESIFNVTDYINELKAEKDKIDSMLTCAGCN